MSITRLVLDEQDHASSWEISNNINLISSGIFFLVAVILYLWPVDHTIDGVVSLVLLVFNYLYYKYGKSRGGPFFTFLALTLFNAGLTVLLSLGVIRDINLYIWGGLNNAKAILDATRYTTICLTIYTAGASIGGGINLSGLLGRVDQKIVLIPSYINWLTIISMLCYLWRLYKNIGVVLSGGYFALYQEKKLIGADAIYDEIAKLFPLCIFALIIIHKNSVTKRRLYAGILLLWSLTYLAQGARQHAFSPIVCLLWLFDSVRGVKNGLMRFLKLGPLVLFVFGFIKAFRNEVWSLSVIIDAFRQSVENSWLTLVGTLTEMGGSFGATAWSMHAFPDPNPYKYGFTYLIGLTRLIPNLFWNIHPATMYSLGDWLTSYVEPFIFQSGGGLGFSAVAESYVNFGYLGCVVFLILGLIISMFEPKKSGSVTLFLYASLLASMMAFPRGEFANQVRVIFLYPALVIGPGWFLGHKKQRLA